MKSITRRRLASSLGNISFLRFDEVDRREALSSVADRRARLELIESSVGFAVSVPASEIVDCTFLSSRLVVVTDIGDSSSVLFVVGK